MGHEKGRMWNVRSVKLFNRKEGGMGMGKSLIAVVAASLALTSGTAWNVGNYVPTPRTQIREVRMAEKRGLAGKNNSRPVTTEQSVDLSDLYL